MTIWRADVLGRKRKQVNDAPRMLRRPLDWCALSLAGGAIWSMHFLGMSALRLHVAGDSGGSCGGGGGGGGGGGAPVAMAYQWWMTAVSLAACLAMLRVGVEVAARDVYTPPDRVAALMKPARALAAGRVISAQQERSKVPLKSLRSGKQKWRILVAAYFGRLEHLIGGAALTALGVILMHYLGMLAMTGEFRIVWIWWWVGVSCLIALVVSLAGFWILFRLLIWKASLAWLKPACAVVIAVAVCAMHYTGVFAATYVYVPGRQAAPASFQVTPEVQLGICAAVLIAALAAERAVCQDLRSAYAQLQDTNLFSMFSSDGRRGGAPRGGRTPTSSMFSSDGRRGGAPRGAQVQ
ncbi:hypothetical protein JKP88DRAFT_289686 [Tribonema minus]|uniref:MHYT domain-containing protein n=1 Tax=Tribonema minus TaxID=303371 RepID=A0A836CGL2_9STRA|nr:hypothetical protein JKP88DRAFT_289686 [Tribonema minus]